jgi:hypothetical protein
MKIKIVSSYFIIMTIDTIIEDKKEFQRIISSISDINEEKYAKEVATEIASKYKKLARKYHPDKFGQKKFQSVPYVSQIWFLLVGSKEIRDGIESSFTPYGELIRKYRFPKHWDEEESKKNLGPIQERIQQIRDEEKNDEKVKENVRKKKSLKIKEEEEKERIRKEISLKRRQDEEETERIRREKSLKRKEDEDAKKHKIEEERKEKIRRQDSIELKIQRRKQFTEDEKKFKKEKEKRDKEDEEQQEKIRRQDSLNKKVLRARQFEEDERENKQDILNKKNDEMDIEVIQMDIDDKHLSKQNVRNNTTSRNNTTRKQQNRLNDRISDFMKNKTVKRRELINKYRNKHKTEKMDIVNSDVLPKYRSRTQKKRRSAEDRISDYFTL